MQGWSCLRKSLPWLDRCAVHDENKVKIKLFSKLLGKKEIYKNFTKETKLDTNKFPKEVY